MTAKKPPTLPPAITQILEQVDAKFVREEIGVSLPRGPQSGKITEKDANAEGICLGSFLVVEAYEVASDETPFEEAKANIAHAYAQLIEELTMALHIVNGALPFQNDGTVIEGARNDETISYIFHHWGYSYDVTVFKDGPPLLTAYGAMMNVDFGENEDPDFGRDQIMMRLDELGFSVDVDLYDEKHVCDNCGWEGTEDELQTKYPDIPNVLERMDPGGVVPTGTCPKCACLCYLERTKTW